MATKPQPKVKLRKLDPKLLRTAKAQNLRPLHVRHAVLDKGLPESQLRIQRFHKFKPGALKLKPTLDVAKFAPALHAKLHASVTGYAWQLRRNGVTTVSGNWQWAQTHKNAGQGWSHDTRMHIASVSKLVTAMAVAHRLHQLNRSYDWNIKDFLPDYWQQGPSTNQLTFRHLLTHRSGFKTGGSASDFMFMKSQYAMGVAGNIGKYDYENMNFGLCRILIPVLFGWIHPSETFGTATDHIWDYRTTLRFKEYCQTNIFSPSGVSNIGFTPTGKRALAYRFPHANVGGWDSGDLRTVCGGAGFRMSVNELLDVMGTFRRSSKIVPPSKAQQLLSGSLGIDQIIDTPAGKLYNKNGAWGDSDTDTRMEQSVAFFMPENMELVLFVNSPIKGNGSLRNMVTDTY
ncbi:MAG: beta-lactamase family protein, partial [Nannocystaceae bacterium]|nr:beta-lactamase family protein [Nannocystaceae bacterium]